MHMHAYPTYLPTYRHIYRLHTYIYMHACYTPIGTDIHAYTHYICISYKHTCIHECICMYVCMYVCNIHMYNNAALFGLHSDLTVNNPTYKFN